MGDKVTEAKKVRIPWPGPRPYDENDWEDFAGRGPEIKKLTDKIGFQRLTVLAGGSGTGKTSLVRAGVIPLLRLERYDELSPQWPVLLLRRWSTQGGGSIEEILASQVNDAIEAIETWGRRVGHERASQDVKALRRDWEKSTTEPGLKGIVRLLGGLARGQAIREERSGIIVVFDQFEELLRARGSIASEALQVVRDLLQSKAPLRIVISMRQEYLYALRQLEKVTGGLSPRTIFLRPLREKTVLEVINEVSQSADVQVDPEVARELVAWLQEATPDRSSSVPEVGLADPATEVEEDTRRPDLLRLQALLRELSHYAVDKGTNRVTKELLEEFGKPYRGDSRRIMGGALERWIEDAIQRKTDSGREIGLGSDQIHVGSYAACADMDEEDLKWQVRRTAIRIGPNLSSLDYKVPQEESVLFQAALGDDVWRLGLKDPQLRDRVQIREGEEGKPPGLEEVGLPRELRKEDRNKLSGIARRKGWSPAKTGDQLVICFRETLHRLAAANILTPTLKKQNRRNTTIWELVHDQFGPSFTTWARERRDTWEDCLSALVISTGIQPIGVPFLEIVPEDGSERLELAHLSWQGCSIALVRPSLTQSDRLTFRKTWFMDCNLTGTIFEECDFFGGGFERCELDGALFRNCGFFEDDCSDAPCFLQCDSSSTAIVGGRIQRVEFRDCELRQPTIDRTVLSKGVLFSHGSRVVQGYFNVSADEDKDVAIQFDEGSRGFLCSASKRNWANFEGNDEDAATSRPMPKVFWKRRVD